MFECEICNMKFDDKIRLERHSKTHSSNRPKRQKKGMPDFEKPDFSQVNI